MNFPKPDLVVILSNLAANGEAVTESSFNEDARKSLLESARSLVAALESPFEVLARMNWLEGPKWVVTRVGYDLKLFSKMLDDNGSPKSCEQLSKLTGADAKLLSRMLKHLTTVGFVRETGINEFAPNAITVTLATRISEGMTKNCYDCMSPINVKFCEYLKKTGYKNPTDKDATAFKYAYGTDLHYFEWLSQPGNEKNLEAMKAHMESKTLGKKWFESSPVGEIFAGAERDGTLMVDIGGSSGHDIIDFQKAYPNMPGKLVLQELPSVIQGLPEGFPEDAVRPQVHDMFTPQPIYGAKAYYLHMVLHDWPDESCRKILENLKPAMKKGYSKVLLNEILIEDQNANWFATSMDMLMMLVHSAQERTESDWRALAESAGMKVTKIWDCEGNPEKLIELELP